MTTKKEKVLIFDTTLRDGEQAPGASLNSGQKLEIAYQLENLGVDIIEAGFPIASPDDFKAVDIICRQIKKSIICGLARCLKADIEFACNALKKAKRSRVHIFLATSKIHLKYKFKKAENEIINLVKKSTEMARNLCGDIEFSPEDATRTERDFLFKVIEAAIKQGARTINIPDTVGYSYPQEVHSLITDIINNVPNINKAAISIHCHDDLGMSSANSLSAVLAGARQVHCTMNGIGERAGNASLEEVVMAINTRSDVFRKVFTSIKTEEIFRTSRLVSNLTGFVVPPNKAIVGKNAFAHEAGIHQDAILKKRSTYEIMDPKDVGISESKIVLGKHSGRHALESRLRKITGNKNLKCTETIFNKFKKLADKKKDVFEDDLIALLDEEIKIKKKVYELVSLKVVCGTGIVPEATVTIKHQKKNIKSRSTGDGPVDACFKAIDKSITNKVKLLSYELEAITKGKDAQGRVRTEIMVKGKIVSGRGFSTDILEASVKAYLDALNKLK